MRLRIAPVEVVNDEGDRFRSVARRFEGLQAHASELEDLAIAKRNEYIRCLRHGSQIDFCAYPIAQFQMSSNEIGMEMRQEYVLDLKSVLGSKRDVLVRVALRVNDGCRTGLLVSNKVGGVRQARQIELLEDHAELSSRSGRYFG